MNPVVKFQGKGMDAVNVASSFLLHVLAASFRHLLYEPHPPPVSGSGAPLRPAQVSDLLSQSEVSDTEEALLPTSVTTG